VKSNGGGIIAKKAAASEEIKFCNRGMALDAAGEWWVRHIALAHQRQRHRASRKTLRRRKGDVSVGGSARRQSGISASNRARRQRAACDIAGGSIVTA